MIFVKDLKILQKNPLICDIIAYKWKIEIILRKKLMKNNQNSKEKPHSSREKLKSQEKTQNSKKKLKTQGKNTNFWHIHMLAMRKRWPKNKPALTIQSTRCYPGKTQNSLRN